nr:ABC transporter substrate-binding protein [Pseudoxanthomonas sp.]
MYGKLLCLGAMLALLSTGCDRGGTAAPTGGNAEPEAATQTVRISVGSYNLNNLPFFIADAQGYFKDEGLEVRTENFAQGGAKVLQALVAGSTDVAVGFYDHTIQMQAKGKAVTAFMLLSRNSGLVLAGGNRSPFDPARPETIRGTRVGITSPGSSSDFFIRYYLERHGIPASAVSLIGVGSGAAAVAALEQGKVDLLVNYDPAATLIQERGVGRILIDARSDAGAREVYGGIYPTSVLYAQQSFIEKHPDAIQKIVRAERRALKFIAENGAEAIVAALPDSYVSGDRAVYAKAVESARGIFSVDGRFTETDMATPLAVLAEFNPDIAAARVDLAKTYTNRFVDRASSGH